MDKREIAHFKNKLSDYSYVCEELRRIEEQQLILDTKRGLHGIRYDKEPVQGSMDPLFIELSRLDDTEQYDFLMMEHERYRKKRDYIKWFLETSEIGESIRKIHCDRTSTYENESAKLYMSVRSLKRKVNQEILKYIENGTRYA